MVAVRSACAHALLAYTYPARCGVTCNTGNTMPSRRAKLIFVRCCTGWDLPDACKAPTSPEKNFVVDQPTL